MSNLTDHFGDSASQLIDDLADTLDYSPDGSNPLTVAAIIGYEESRSLVEIDGTKTRYVRHITLPRTAAAAGGGAYIADVRLHDQLTIEGFLYTVEAIVSMSLSWTQVEAYRVATREKTRQGYRRT